MVRLAWLVRRLSIRIRAAEARAARVIRRARVVQAVRGREGVAAAVGLAEQLRGVLAA